MCERSRVRLRFRPEWAGIRRLRLRLGQPLAVPIFLVRPASYHPAPRLPKNTDTLDPRRACSINEAQKRPSVATCQQEKERYKTRKHRLPQARRSSAHSLPHSACCNQRAGFSRVTSSIQSHHSTCGTNSAGDPKLLIMNAVSPGKAAVSWTGCGAVTQWQVTKPQPR
jgi:hypothetical protein